MFFFHFLCFVDNFMSFFKFNFCSSNPLVPVFMCPQCFNTFVSFSVSTPLFPSVSQHLCFLQCLNTFVSFSVSTLLFPSVSQHLCFLQCLNTFNTSSSLWTRLLTTVGSNSRSRLMSNPQLLQVTTPRS